MNTIQTTPNPLASTLSAAPTAAAKAEPITSATGAAALQLFVFVEGEPPADAGLISSATYTAGLAQPAVDARQWPSLAGALDISNVSTTTAAVNVQAQVMALQDLLMKMMMNLRSGSLKNREDDLQLMVKQKNLGIDKGLEAAKTEMVAGMLSGAADIAAGTMSVVGAAKGEGMRGADGFAKVAVGKYSGLGSVMSGALKMASASETYTAATLRAEQQRNELAAEVANTRMAQSNEQANNYREAFKGFMDAQLQVQRDQVDAVKRTFV